MREIERKFLVRQLPADIASLKSLKSERYFLKTEDGSEERISKVGDKYFHDLKTNISNIERTRDKKEISEEQFIKLKERSVGLTVRETYLLSLKPKITVQIYSGEFEGLVRAEVEFSSTEEAASFQPLSWMGDEITGLDIARDSSLLNLS